MCIHDYKAKPIANNYSLLVLVIHDNNKFQLMCKSPAAQDRDLDQPPEELPALQLGGGLLCPPPTSTAGQSRALRGPRPLP